MLLPIDILATVFKRMNKFIGSCLNISITPQKFIMININKTRMLLFQIF